MATRGFQLASSEIGTSPIPVGAGKADRFALLLVVVLLLAYQPAWHGTPVFDDAMRLPKPQGNSVAALIEVWLRPSITHQYHPLVDTVFWMETRLFGPRMLAYHLINVLLHAGAALLLLKILRQLAIPGASLAVALFALHPVQVESVAFLAEMKNTLSTLFLFAAVLAYFRYEAEHDRRWYGLVWLFFVLGLLAKATTAYLPFVLLVLRWWQRGKLEWQRDVRPLFLFFVAGIVAAIATSWFEWRPGAAVAAGVVFSPLERVLIAGRAFWFYAAKILWPANLRMFYPRWTISPLVWWQYLFPVATIAVMALAWSLRRRVRAVWAGLVFFFITLLPFLGFFSLRMFRFQYVAEHFEYLPIIGIVVPLSAGVATGLRRLPDWLGFVVKGGLFVILALLTILSWQHSKAFRDAETCYRDSIAKGGNNWIAHVNLAVILIAQGHTSDAEMHLRKALELRPPDLESVSGIHLDLGQALRQQQRLEEALQEFQRSIETSPNFRAYDAIGSILHEQGNMEQAMANYTKAMQLEPNSPVAPANMAWILATTRNDALRNGRNALELAIKAEQLSGGADPFSLRSLAAALAETGTYPKALETAERALRVANEQRLHGLSEKIQADMQSYERHLPVRDK